MQMKKGRVASDTFVLLWTSLSLCLANSPTTQEESHEGKLDVIMEMRERKTMIHHYWLTKDSGEKVEVHFPHAHHKGKHLHMLSGGRVRLRGHRASQTDVAAMGMGKRNDLVLTDGPMVNATSAK